MAETFNGTISVISSCDLMSNTDLLNKMTTLVTRVYDEGDAELFLQEIKETPDIIISYMIINDNVIGLGCICESHISYGVYELFWDMLDESYRGNGWGKMLIEHRIEYIKEHCKGLSSPNDIIVVTKFPWHLIRCGFEVIIKLNPEGEVLMHRKINNLIQ